MLTAFQFFMAGQKLTELKGADPAALDAYVNQLADLGVESVSISFHFPDF